MPTDYGFRCDDEACLFPAGPEPTSQQPEEPVEQIKPWTRMTPFQHGKLLPQCQILEQEALTRAKEANDGSQGDPEESKHGEDLYQNVGGEDGSGVIEVIDSKDGWSLGEGQPITGDEIIAKMLERNRVRSERLQRFSSVRTYEVQNLQGKLAAQTVVRVDYEAPDKKTFNKPSEKGSGIVRHLMFDHLIQSEGETSSGKEHHDSAITEANYAFELLGEEDLGPYHCFVLTATPKRRDKYLFEGKIWIDTADFAIVKIAGHPAKKSSFWINRADFVREYQRIEGFWLPFRDATFVEIKMYGRKVFSVEHQQYVINSERPVRVETEDAGKPEPQLH